MRARWFASPVLVLLAVTTPLTAQEIAPARLGQPSVSPPALLPDPRVPGPSIPIQDNASGCPSEQKREAFEAEQEVKPVIRVIGRINADAIFVNQSSRNQQTFGIVDNAVGFRRARLGAEGEVGANVYWQAEFDFAGGNIAFKNVFIGLKDIPIVRRLQVGHMCEPFSLEGAQSSNFMPFVERSAIYELDPQRNWGVLALSYTDNEKATCQFGVFRSGTSNNTGDDISNLNDMAYDVRVTALPWYEMGGEQLMHVGAAFSERFPANGEVVFGIGPQSSLLQFTDAPATFIKQITIPASQYQLINLQWAAVLGPLSLQAEWDATNVEQRGGPPVFLNGCYAMASYFLTGEHREYVTKDGTFDNTRVRRPFLSFRKKDSFGFGPGAWELTARFAYARFTNANLPLENGVQQGDNEAETTIGVNWYLNDNMRIMFNYIHDVPVAPGSGPSFANAFFIRTALFW